MPRYEFECNKCKENFEILMSIKDRESAKIICPECKSNDIAQIFTGINIIIKDSSKTGSKGCCGGCGESGCCR